MHHVGLGNRDVVDLDGAVADRDRVAGPGDDPLDEHGTIVFPAHGGQFAAAWPAQPVRNRVHDHELPVLTVGSMLGPWPRTDRMP